MRPDSISTVKSLPSLACAALGGMIGVLLATFIASAFLDIGGHPDVMPAGLLPWVHDQVLLEPREKGFYLLALFFGSLGAWWGSGRRSLLLISLPQGSFLLLFSAILLDLVIGYSLRGKVSAWPCGLAAAAAACVYLRYTIEESITPEREASNPWAEAKTLFIAPGTRRIHLWLWGLLFLLIMPGSFEEAASNVGFNMHAVSFLFGPATYFNQPGLLPGIDFFTQYGLGWGWLFHPLLGNSADTTLIHYAELITLVMILFHAQLFYLLWWLCDSWKAAMVTAIFMAIFLFVTNHPFMAPSSSPMRYPLLLFVAALLPAWNRNLRLALTLAISFCLALCIFLNTETGLYMSIAAALASLLDKRLRILPHLVLLALLIGVWLMSLLWLAFGGGIFTMEFLRQTMLPILIYGGAGMGGWPVVWKVAAIHLDHGIYGEWNLLYNVIAPGLALATLGMAARRRIGGERAVCLTFFALMGLLMSAKYLNMSVTGVWEVNSLGLMLVLSWWVQTYLVAARAMRPVRLGARTIGWYRVSFGVAAASIIALTVFVGDKRNMNTYGLQAWVHYPSVPHLVDRLIRRQRCVTLDCTPNHPDDKDIALIAARSKPGEPVALIDQYDWTYLIAVHRASAASFLPSNNIYLERDMAQTMERFYHADYIFLPKAEKGMLGKHDGYFDNPDIAKWLLPEIKAHFKFDAAGEKLVAWKRASPHMPEKKR